MPGISSDNTHSAVGGGHLLFYNRVALEWAHTSTPDCAQPARLTAADMSRLRSWQESRLTSDTEENEGSGRGETIGV